MTFKFGLLVLLLFLENTVAEKRRGRVPTVDLVSALEYVPHLRRDLLLAEKSPVQRLPLGSFRQSSKPVGTICAWVGPHGKCSPSNSTMKYLLEKSNTEFAKMIVERLTCEEKTTYKSCIKNKACLWNFWLEECNYMDTRRHHEDSPCAKAAPRQFDAEKALTQCYKIVSIKRCERKRYCKWESLFGFCSVDGSLIYYGVRHLLDKVDQIEDSVKATLKAEYTALQSADNFTWQSLLEYKPKVECPPDMEQLVCEYAVAYWSNILAPQFYCPGKYESAASGCKADVWCRRDADSAECKSDEETAQYYAEFSASKVKQRHHNMTYPLAYRYLLTRCKRELTRRFLKLCTCVISFMPVESAKVLLHACLTPVSYQRCSARICIYNPQRDLCRPRKDYIASLITEAGHNSTDALCTYLKVNGFSDCWNRFSEPKCERGKFCRVNSIHRCEPSEELFFSAAAAEDPRLKRRYQRFKTGCALYTSETACVKSSEVY